MTESNDRQTVERLHQHLARADLELRDAQHFLDPAAAEESEMDLVGNGGPHIAARSARDGHGERG